MFISDLDHFNSASVDSSITGGSKKYGYGKKVYSYSKVYIEQDADAFADSKAYYGNASSVAVAQNAANVGYKNEIEQEVDIKTYQYFKK